MGRLAPSSGSCLHRAHSALCLTLALTFSLASVSAAPLGSISSMEVNVDMLEQMDMMDLSDQDTVDVFLGCGTEESGVAGPLPGTGSPEHLAGQVGSPSCPPCPRCLILQPQPPCVQIHTHPHKDRHLVLGSVRLEGPHPGLVHVSIHLHSPELQTPVNTLTLQKAEEPRHFPESVGPVLLA